MMKRVSEIKEFLREECVLVTGATGFLGKTLVEKLLRTCETRKIYILVRSKKGTLPQDRKEQLFQQSVFDRLKAEGVEFASRVAVVSGDITAPDMGMSEEDMAEVVSRVTLVIHSAATVNFDESLKSAVATNVAGTLHLLNMYHRIHNLKCVIHISTAYAPATADRMEVEERLYSSPMDPEKLLKIGHVNDEHLEIISAKLLNQWPNTYTFTKIAAEELVQKHAGNLPIAIFRPAIISGAFEEPEQGWVDNLYGATGLMAGGGSGLVRVLHISGNVKAQVIPVDFTVNAILALAYRVSHAKERELKVYNYAWPRDSGLTFDEFSASVCETGSQMPSLKTLWYYTSMTTSHPFVFKILNLLFHIVPAYFFDLILYLRKGKTRVIKVYQKVLKLMRMVSYFTLIDWHFHRGNTEELWAGLSPVDKALFNFDLNSLDWPEYIRRSVKGVRLHIFKEPLQLLSKSKARYYRLYLMHRLVQVLFYTPIIWAFVKIVCPSILSAISSYLSFT